MSRGKGSFIISDGAARLQPERAMWTEPPPPTNATGIADATTRQTTRGGEKAFWKGERVVGREGSLSCGESCVEVFFFLDVLFFCVGREWDTVSICGDRRLKMGEGGGAIPSTILYRCLDAILMGGGSAVRRWDLGGGERRHPRRGASLSFVDLTKALLLELRK